MKGYKIGILGYGGFGKFLHSKWSDLDRVEVVAICDERGGTKSGGVPFYSSSDAFFDSDIDIVSIATPPSTHRELALQAISAGKHVLIEKPIALSIEDVDEIVKAANAGGVVVSTNYMLRFNPLVKALKEIVNGDILGELLNVSVTNVAQDESLPKEHWFWDKSVSGGILVEHAVHFFDMVYFISGQPATRVEGFSAWRNTRQEDRVLGVVRHTDGLMATHFHAFRRPGFIEETSVRFVFDFGEFELRGWIPLEGSYKGLMNERLDKILLNYIDRNSVLETSLSATSDVSRPEGWGDHEEVEIADIIRENYSAYGQFKFGINRRKTDVYGECVVDSLLDLIDRVESGSTGVIGEDAFYEALRIALLADRSADMHR